MPTLRSRRALENKISAARQGRRKEKQEKQERIWDGKTNKKNKFKFFFFIVPLPCKKGGEKQMERKTQFLQIELYKASVMYVSVCVCICICVCICVCVCVCEV